MNDDMISNCLNELFVPRPGYDCYYFYTKKRTFVENIPWLIGCACVIVLSFFLTYFRVKTGPGTRVIANGYPVTKMGNAANQQYVCIQLAEEQELTLCSRTLPRLAVNSTHSNSSPIFWRNSSTYGRFITYTLRHKLHTVINRIITGQTVNNFHIYTIDTSLFNISFSWH